MALRISLIVAFALLSSALSLPHNAFAIHVDRNFAFGEDDDELGVPVAGVTQVGQFTSTGDTFDGGGDNTDGLFDDLTPSGSPIYASTTGRPLLAGNGLGIAFDGSNDYLIGNRLGLPDTSFLASGGDNPGPRDYTGIVNRGFQLWVNPSSSGAGSTQSVVADTNQHGVRISAANTWVMRYAGTDVDSGVAVDFDQWSHVMVVRPFGGTGPNSGSRLYVDGVAIAAATGGYTGTDNSPLVIGANTGAMPGTAEYFAGVLDALDLFVLGTSTSDPPTVYGEFNFAADNEFAADALGAYVAGDTNLDGLVQGDGSGALGAADDVKNFIDNWRIENLVTGVRAGDIGSPGRGDFNFDGITDIADWILLTNSHVNAASLNLGDLLAGGAQVPEPSAIVLLAAGAIGAVVLRLRSRKAALTCLMVCVAGGLVNTVGAANFWNIDLQGDSGSTLFGQSGTADLQPNDDDGVWNAFDVEGFEQPIVLSTNPSVNLVDNDGNASPVTFSLTGDYVGWNGNPGADPLIGDYLFIYRDPANTLGIPVQPAVFTISGLSAGASYGLRFITGANVGRPLDLLVDSNGDNLLTDESIVFAPGGGVRTPINVTSNGSGEISGEIYIANNAAEGNLAGIQITVGRFPQPNPRLLIDRATGGMVLENDTDSPLNIIGYEILSAAGGLDPSDSNWLSIADNYDANDGGEVDSGSQWIEFTGPGENDNLGEGQQPGGGGASFANGPSSTIDLGTPWIRSPLEDVTMRLALADGSLVNVSIAYSGDPYARGDFDLDGDVDIGDWNAFKSLFGNDLTGLSLVQQYFGGDLTGDGQVTLADARAFQDSFDAVNGAGAFLAAINAVPEPSSIALTLLACGIVAGVRRRCS